MAWNVFSPRKCSLRARVECVSCSCWIKPSLDIDHVQLFDADIQFGYNLADLLFAGSVRSWLGVLKSQV